MKTELPDKIKVTIPVEVYTELGYIHSTNCYLARALKTLGYENVNVGGSGYTEINDVHYETEEIFDAITVEREFAKGNSINIILIKTTKHVQTN